MSQEMNYKKLCEALRENAEWCDANEWEIPICMGDNQRDAADAIQYLLDGADEVNQALREQIEANERLTAENERLSRPTLSQLRRERIQLMGENEKLKAELERKNKAIENMADIIKSAYKQRDAAVADIRFMLSHPDDGCDLCGNKRECKEEKCPAYTSGIGAIDQQSGKEYPDFKWTCMDFEHGTCDFLENTPCNGCDFKNHWKWRGVEQEDAE